MEYMILPPALRGKFTPDQVEAIKNAAVEDYASDCHFFTEEDVKLIEMVNAGVLTKTDALALRAWIKNPTYVAQADTGAIAGDFSLHPPIAIVTGWVAYVAAKELADKPWADWKEKGFLSQIEALQTLSCLLTESRMDHHKGYRWIGPTGEYIIGGDINADLRIYRYPAGIAECHYGEIVSRVQPSEIKELLAGYHSTEGALLAALIAASWQTGYVLDCLKDYPAFEAQALAIIEGLHCPPPNFCPTGMSDFDAASHAGSATWPLTPAGDSRCVHFLCREHGDPYTLHLDGDDIVASYHKAVAMRLPQGDWNEMVMGLFIQAARHGGRTPVGTLAEVVRIAGQPETRSEFDSNVKLVRESKTKTA